MKNKKPKTIKYPKTQNEAFELVFNLCQKFNFEAILLSKNDFKEHYGTENWTEKHYQQAIELATEELCEQVGYVIDEAFIQVNKNKNLN